MYRNRFELIGRVAQPLTVRSLPSGGDVAIVCVATNKSFLPKGSSDPKIETKFHYVSLFGRHSNYAIKALQVGTCVLLEGKLGSQTLRLESGAQITVPELCLSERDHKITVLSQPQQYVEAAQQQPQQYGEAAQQQPQQYGEAAQQQPQQYGEAAQQQPPPHYSAPPQKTNRPF